MKLILLLSIISIISFFIIVPLLQSITCSIKSTCGVNEYCLFSRFQENDTHVGNCTEYENKTCCSDPYLTSVTFEKVCNVGEFSFIAMYNYTDSHVESFNNSILELRFDDGSGDIAFDSSGQGNHGRIYEATWTTGKYGNALSFDGINDYVSVPYNDILNVTENFTVSFWFKANNVTSHQSLVDKGRDYYGSGWRVYINNNGLYFSVNNNTLNDGNELILTTSFTDTQDWHFVTVTYGVDGGKLYLDNDLKDFDNYIGPVVYKYNENVTIGALAYSTNYFNFNGTIDEVRIYNRVLSWEEINASYYEYRVCLSCPWICNLRTSCLPDEYCLISLNSTTNSHIGECGYYDYQLCCKREDIPPSYSNQGQNASSIYPSDAIELYAFWEDNGKLSHAWLATNETGTWKNYTDGTYGSPLSLNSLEGWSNFTWQNSSILRKTKIAWKIYVNDTCGNEYMTSEQIFEMNQTISAVISLKLLEGIFFTNRTGSELNQQFNVEINTWNNASWNYNSSDVNRRTEFWIQNTGTGLEDFCFKANSDLVCNEGLCVGTTITIDNVAWNNATSNDITSPSFDTSKRLSLNYQKIAYNVNPDEYIYLRFWLFVPTGKPSGKYNTTFSVKVVEAGTSC